MWFFISWKKQQYTRKHNLHIHICKQFKPQNPNYSNLLHSKKRTTTFDGVFFPNLFITTTKNTSFTFLKFLNQNPNKNMINSSPLIFKPSKQTPPQKKNAFTNTETKSQLPHSDKFVRMREQFSPRDTKTKSKTK